MQVIVHIFLKFSLGSLQKKWALLDVMIASDSGNKSIRLLQASIADDECQTDLYDNK